jgi:uncharacterized protein (DUF2461 family)
MTKNKTIAFLQSLAMQQTRSRLQKPVDLTRQELITPPHFDQLINALIPTIKI